MAEFASKGVAGSGLGLGIAGTALGLLNGAGGLAALANNAGCNGYAAMGCGCGCSENQAVNRYELDKENEIARLRSECDMLKSDQRTDNKILELYRYVDGQFRRQGEELADLACKQAVTNQSVADNLRFVDNRIDGVYTEMDHRFRSVYQTIDCRTLPLEKKLPLDSICPQPMQRYNSWVAPTETPTETTEAT